MYTIFRRTIRLLGFLLLLSLLLVGCKKNNPDLGPSSYILEDESVPALCVVGDDFGIYEVLEEEASLDEEGNPLPHDPSRQVHTYRELEHAGQTIEQYVAVLTDPKIGFGVVNAAGSAVPPPDYSQETGFVVLSRGDHETKKLLRLTITWEEAGCTVVANLMDALPARTAGEEQKNASNEISRSSTSGMSAAEVVTFFEGLSPDALGLNGNDMSDYNVYYMDGKVMINGEACMRVRIYQHNPVAETNIFIGTFLVSGNQAHIFKHNPQSDKMEQLR